VLLRFGHLLEKVSSLNPQFQDFYGQEFSLLFLYFPLIREFFSDFDPHEMKGFNSIIGFQSLDPRIFLLFPLVSF